MGIQFTPKTALEREAFIADQTIHHRGALLSRLELPVITAA